MSKEQMEEIESKINWLELRPSQIVIISRLIDYAKEQAQRVQELENEIERLKDIYYQCKEWGEQQTEKFQEIVGTRIDIEENELDERETIR